MIGYGFILLIWMSLEDKGTLTVSLLGTGAAIIYIGFWLINRYSDRELDFRLWFSGIVLSGTVIGAASAFTAAMLMFFKSGWHGHLYPDYPPQLIASMLSRMPVWAISGTLIGLFCAILILLRQSQAL